MKLRCRAVGRPRPWRTGCPGGPEDQLRRRPTGIEGHPQGINDRPTSAQGITRAGAVPWPTPPRSGLPPVRGSSGRRLRTMTSAWPGTDMPRNLCLRTRTGRGGGCCHYSSITTVYLAGWYRDHAGSPGGLRPAGCTLRSGLRERTCRSRTCHGRPGRWTRRWRARRVSAHRRHRDQRHHCFRPGRTGTGRTDGRRDRRQRGHWARDRPACPGWGRRCHPLSIGAGRSWKNHCRATGAVASKAAVRCAPTSSRRLLSTHAHRVI